MQQSFTVNTKTRYMLYVYCGPTSSDISVAIALPISWYDLALPLGPSKMNKNLQMEQNHRIDDTSTLWNYPHLWCSMMKCNSTMSSGYFYNWWGITIAWKSLTTETTSMDVTANIFDSLIIVTPQVSVTLAALLHLFRVKELAVDGRFSYIF